MVTIDSIIDPPTGSTTGGSLSQKDQLDTPTFETTIPMECLPDNPQSSHFTEAGTDQETAAGDPGDSPVSSAVVKPVPVWKHFLDWFCILFTLPFTAPLMLLIALWIKVVSRGPVIFRQTRIGKDEKPFMLFKFRTMKVDAKANAHHRYFRTIVKGNLPMTKMDSYHDKRLIPGGWFLRVTGLDELPQLLNVLQRTMSLVGPRPCLPEEMTWYDESQRERFQCLPGITGYWQVNGKNSTTFEEMIELDTYYSERTSFLLDTAIIVGTIPALVSHAMKSRQERTKLRNVPLPLRPDTVRIE